MGFERIAEPGLSAMDALEKFLKGAEVAGAVADEGLNIKDAFEGSKLGQWLSKTNFAKGMRIAMTLAAMIPNIATAGPPTKESLHKGAQVIEAGMNAHNKRVGGVLHQAIAQPSREVHVKTLEKVRIGVERLRAQPQLTNGPIKQVALEIVLANIIDQQTSSFLKELRKPDSGVSEAELEEWTRHMNIRTNFSELYKSPVMTEPAQRAEFANAVHELYANKEIEGIQNLVRDSRLMYNYEVIFGAINNVAYREKNPDRVKEAADFLLNEGNIEEAVDVLSKSGSNVYLEQLVGFLSRYVPDSQFAHKYGERVRLDQEDPQFRALNA